MTMKSIRSLALAMVVATPLMLVPAEADAAFHLIRIRQVYPGSYSEPNAQFVMLQAYSSFQTSVGGHTVEVYDASDNLIDSFTFGGNMASGNDQDTILIATTEAETFFGVTADLAMTAVIPLAGGKVCFDTIDCVSWGTYSGPATGTGTPFAGGFGLSVALERDISGGTNGTGLDGGDDTDDSDADFFASVPAPVANDGSAGTIPASSCGDAAIDGLEFCDGANLGSEDCVSQGFASGTLACNGTCDGFDTAGCVAAVCGDGTCDPGEDFNSCPVDCPAVCGNDTAEGAEVCDGSDLAGEDCVSQGFDAGPLACNGTCDGFDTSGCTTGPACGNGFADPGEVCDGADLGGQDCAGLGFDGGTLACSTACDDFDTSGCTTAPACGDGTVDAGEQCDDGNTTDGDGCDSQCQTESSGGGGGCATIGGGVGAGLPAMILLMLLGWIGLRRRRD